MKWNTPEHVSDAFVLPPNGSWRSMPGTLQKWQKVTDTVFFTASKLGMYQPVFLGYSGHFKSLFPERKCIKRLIFSLKLELCQLFQEKTDFSREGGRSEVTGTVALCRLRKISAIFLAAPEKFRVVNGLFATDWKFATFERNSVLHRDSFPWPINP